MQELLDGVFLGSIYALFALGYTLVFGVLDVVNLAHSAVFMLGAVFAYSFVALHGVSFWLAAPLAICCAGAVGAVIELVALRPLRRRGGMGSIPGTIVGGYVLGLIEVLALLAFGSNARAGIAFAVLFLMLVFRPQGLLGTRTVERV